MNCTAEMSSDGMTYVSSLKKNDLNIQITCSVYEIVIKTFRNNTVAIDGTPKEY
jgi:hypothetical protein